MVRLFIAEAATDIRFSYILAAHYRVTRLLTKDLAKKRVAPLPPSRDQSRNVLVQQLESEYSLEYGSEDTARAVVVTAIARTLAVAVLITTTESLAEIILILT